MKTFNVTPGNINKKWVVVDAAGQTVGRLATEVARTLRGKNKPNFTPYLDCGDNVIVINAAKVKFTGNKWAAKEYHDYSGFIGGMRTTTAQEMLDSHPDRIITRAVKGMLPKNKLSRHLMTNLRVYSGADHGQAAQNPVEMAPRTKA